MRALICCVIGVVALSRGHDLARTEVATRDGRVAGIGTDVVTFKGIPYAAPPVGRLRWRPTEPSPHWSGVRIAAEFGPRCPQPPSSASPAAASNPPTSEDCLTLNVWTPMRSSGDKLPVMVWIHGGGFFGGTASSPAYDGEALARRGVVVVTLNYRIGALGFLAHPDLSAESSRHVSGNYGLLDQIAALKWVQQNIGAFGGDPQNVTVFGGSAGAYSISVLMVSPLAKGLFHRAILESLPLGFRPVRRLRASRPLLLSAESEGKSLAADIGPMRRLDAQEVVARMPSSPTLS